MSIFYLPKLVVKEIERLLEHCRNQSNDCFQEMEEEINRLIDSLEEAKSRGYLRYKN